MLEPDLDRLFADIIFGDGFAFGEAAAEGLDVEAEEVGFGVGEGLAAEGFDVFCHVSEDIDVLFDDAPGHGLEGEADEAADFSEGVGDDSVDLGFALVDGGALGGDDEVAAGAEVVIDAADIRDDEAVGVAELAAFGKEEFRDEGGGDGFALELDAGAGLVADDIGGEGFCVGGAEPAAVDVDGVRAVEEIFEAGIDTGLEAGFHDEGGPARVAEMGEGESGRSRVSPRPM